MLRYKEEPDFQPLNVRALKQIIRQVNRWHDSVLSTALVNGAGANKEHNERTSR
jgi:hypothetical protein